MLDVVSMAFYNLFLSVCLHKGIAKWKFQTHPYNSTHEECEKSAKVVI